MARRIAAWSPRNKHRRGTVYLMVLMVSAIVAVVAVGGSVVRRHMLRGSGTEARLAKARAAARSALELSLATLRDGTGWTVHDAWVPLTYAVTDGVALGGRIVSADTGTLLAQAELSTAATFVLLAESDAGDAAARLAIDLAVIRDPLHERVLDVGPVRYWPLDDAPGSTTARELTASATGTYARAAIPGATEGPEGGPAAGFATASDVCQAATSASLNTMLGTVVCWVRPSASTDNALIFAKTGSTPNTGDFGLVRFGGSLLLTHVGTPNSVTLTGPDLRADEWAFVAYAFRPNWAGLYINGVWEDTESRTVAMIHSTGDAFRIGGPGSGTVLGAADSVRGSVYGFAFFSRVLTDEELSEIGSFGPYAVTPQPQTLRWLVD